MTPRARARRERRRAYLARDAAERLGSAPVARLVRRLSSSRASRRALLNGLLDHGARPGLEHRPLVVAGSGLPPPGAVNCRSKLVEAPGRYEYTYVVEVDDLAWAGEGWAPVYPAPADLRERATRGLFDRLRAQGPAGRGGTPRGG